MLFDSARVWEKHTRVKLQGFGLNDGGGTDVLNCLAAVQLDHLVAGVAHHGEQPPRELRNRLDIAMQNVLNRQRRRDGSVGVGEDPDECHARAGNANWRNRQGFVFYSSRGKQSLLMQTPFNSDCRRG